MKNLIFLFVILLNICCVYIAHGNEYYVSSNNTTTEIEEHGLCENVTNNSGDKLFVPTKTFAEYSAFLNNKYTGVTSNACTKYEYRTLYIYSRDDFRHNASSGCSTLLGGEWNAYSYGRPGGGTKRFQCRHNGGSCDTTKYIESSYNPGGRGESKYFKVTCKRNLGYGIIYKSSKKDYYRKYKSKEIYIPYDIGGNLNINKKLYTSYFYGGGIRVYKDNVLVLTTYSHMGTVYSSSSRYFPSVKGLWRIDVIGTNGLIDNSSSFVDWNFNLKLNGLNTNTINF